LFCPAVKLLLYLKLYNHGLFSTDTVYFIGMDFVLKNIYQITYFAVTKCLTPGIFQRFSAGLFGSTSI